MNTKVRYYTKRLANPVIDTPEMRAAAAFVIAVDQKSAIPTAVIHQLYAAFLRMFSGESPSTVWGKPSAVGDKMGFTIDEIISAFVELERRADLQRYGAIRRAQDKAAWAFNKSGVNAIKQIERSWRHGRKTVESLSDDELRGLISVYEKTNKK